jgi:hypothetical protein
MQGSEIFYLIPFVDRNCLLIELMIESFEK